MKTRLLLIAFLSPLICYPASAAVEPRCKAPLTGLVQMGDIGFHRRDGGVATNSLANLRQLPGVFGGAVINVAWGQIEPSRGKLETGEIDRMLADIRAYNQSCPQNPIGGRLRVWPGPNAPVWAKNLGGAPVTVLHKGMPITVGRFWSKPYRDAWRDFQARLAAHYDAEPLIREVSNGSGSSITDEVMILPGDPLSVSNLLAVGFTDRQRRACLWESPADYAGWVSTPVELTCSPVRDIESGRSVEDKGFTLELMRHWRETFGPRGVVGNHALTEPIQAHLGYIYDELSRLGPPVALQTHSPSGLDWPGALRAGLKCKAGSIELWTGTKNGGFETKSPETLREWASWFHRQMPTTRMLPNQNQADEFENRAGNPQ